MSEPVRLASHEWLPSRTDAGAPAPVAVLVHGITGWWRTWWRVAPNLADRGWRVIALDQRGHGTSHRIDGVANADSFAADIEATIDALGVAPVDVLVGHSLGAAVSMELVHRRPDIARRLVLEDPPSQDRADDFAFQATLEREVRAARSDADSEVRRELDENRTWLEEDARQDVEGKAASDLEGILASLRSGTGLRVIELAPSIRIPTLYLLASEDRSALGSRRADLLGSLPESATVLEMDSGHTVHRDRFDAYLPALLGWLNDA